MPWERIVASLLQTTAGLQAFPVELGCLDGVEFLD